jgi:hypothetical protein
MSNNGLHLVAEHSISQGLLTVLFLHPMPAPRSSKPASSAPDEQPRGRGRPPSNRPPDEDEAASAADQQYIEALRLRLQRLEANP